jgi:hypothetical protein
VRQAITFIIVLFVAIGAGVGITSALGGPKVYGPAGDHFIASFPVVPTGSVKQAAPGAKISALTPTTTSQFSAGSTAVASKPGYFAVEAVRFGHGTTADLQKEIEELSATSVAELGIVLQQSSYDGEVVARGIRVETTTVRTPTGARLTEWVGLMAVSSGLRLYSVVAQSQSESAVNAFLNSFTPVAE